MKKILPIIILITLLSNFAFCEATSTLTEKNVATFVKLLPEYQELVKKAGISSSGEVSEETINNLKKQTDELFKKYGTSQGTFEHLVEKVSIAFSAAQMQANGVDPLKLGIPEMKNLSQKDIDVVKKHMRELKKIFEGN